MKILQSVQTSLGGFQPVSQNAPFSWGSTSKQEVLDNMENFISYVIGLITIVAGLFFVVNFLLAALNWVTAGGDAGKIQKARDQMVQSTLGLVVVVGAYAIIGLIGTIVGLDLLQPAVSLLKIIP